MILKLPGGRSILYSAITELIADDGIDPDPAESFVPGVYVRFLHTGDRYRSDSVYVCAEKGQSELQLLAVIEEHICTQTPFDASNGDRA